MARWILLVAVLGLAWKLAADSRQPRDRAGERPNVILIVTDDQPAGYVDLMPRTKSRLVDQGMTFRNAFATTSLCCPSRASILSGAYASTHGITTLGGAPIFDARDTVATRLRGAGYRTALFGKYLNDNKKLSPRVPPGWDEWRTFADSYASFTDEDHLYYTYELNENGTMVSYGDAPEDYSTDVLVRFAVEFLRSAPEPFFLYLAPYAPHVPPVPAERHIGAYADLEPTADPSRFEADVSDKPKYVHNHKEALEAEPFLTTGEWKSHFRGTMESLLALDEGIDRLFDALDARAIAGRTLILYISDNGMLFGSHWGMAKSFPYEGSIKVPFYAWYPKEIAPGSATDAIVANIDVAPTICAIAGVDPPARNQGRSLRPLFSGGSVGRTSIFLEWLRDPPGMGPWLGIRAPGWKYIWYAQDGFEELYDLAGDPYELDNLAVVSPHEHLRVLQRFRRRVDRAKVKHGLAARAAVSE